MGKTSMTRHHRAVAAAGEPLGFAFRRFGSGGHAMFEHPTAGVVWVSGSPRDADAQLVQATQDMHRKLRDAGIDPPRRGRAPSVATALTQAEIRGHILTILDDVDAPLPMTADEIYDAIAHHGDMGRPPSPGNRVPNGVYTALASLRRDGLIVADGKRGRHLLLRRPSTDTADPPAPADETPRAPISSPADPPPMSSPTVADTTTLIAEIRRLNGALVAAVSERDRLRDRLVQIRVMTDVTRSGDGSVTGDR